MRPNFSVIAVLGLAALASCGGTSKQADKLALDGWADASAPLINSKGVEIGFVGVRQATDGVFLRVAAKKMKGGWHGVHFHQTADCSDAAEGFKKAGSHFDPDSHQHGLMQADGGERGDLPNVFATKKGKISAEIFRPGVLLRPSEEGAARIGPFALLDDDGFAVVVHEDADDQKSQPIGGSGDRVACAAIRS